MLDCQLCGAQFKKRYWGTNQFCSRACRDVALRKPPNRKCLHCGKAFRAKGGSAPGKYCSYRCREEAQPDRVRARRCSVCRAWTVVSAGRARKTCSNTCFRESQRRNQLRVRGLEQTKVRRIHSRKLRFIIIDSDGFRCRYCGRTASDDGVNLHIDHVTPLAKAEPRQTFYLSEFVTSCFDCNEGKKDMILSQPSRAWLIANTPE